VSYQVTGLTTAHERKPSHSQKKVARAACQKNKTKQQTIRQKSKACQHDTTTENLTAEKPTENLFSTVHLRPCQQFHFYRKK
jgi:hypothetical protein